jgi:hypothetical protein
VDDRLPYRQAHRLLLITYLIELEYFTVLNSGNNP